MKKQVLFACVENSCRSQIAEGFANTLGEDVLIAYSAGSNPLGMVDHLAIQVMREEGIDISGAISKGFENLADKEFDFVIGMGCNDICPFLPNKEYRQWRIEDPAGEELAFFREVRDEIRKNVESLINELRNKKKQADKQG